ncbi:MAG: purine-nucleoside phosphorylase, partial [Candidatus Latescibacterota bacterium]
MSIIESAVSAIRDRDSRVPEVALILGSGLGSLADSVDNPTVIPGTDIPGYPQAGVAGHRGDLVIGELDGRVVAFLRGRFHRYEGHDMQTLTLPVRIASGIGAGRLIVTNAAGSLTKTMPAGSIMRITDHINTTG